MKSNRVNTYLSIVRYLMKTIQVLQQDLYIVQTVPATVHSPAHAGFFGMKKEMLGRKTQPCLYSAKVTEYCFENLLVFIKHKFLYPHFLLYFEY